MRLKFWALILLLSFGVSAAGLRAQRGPSRELIKISDNLYRTRNGAWYGLVYVTPGGIVLADPISTDFAGWVKTELERRFPGIPIRYIIYSHSHWDHIEGAAVFGDARRLWHRKACCATWTGGTRTCRAI